MNRYLLWFTFFFVFLGTGSSQPYISPYLKQVLGFSYFKYSSVLAVIYFSMCIGRIFAPKILKLVGLKKGIILGSFSYGIFALIFVLTGKYVNFILAGIFWGLGASIFWTAAITLILQMVSSKRYGVENGILRVFVQAGLIIGFLILGQILVKGGYKTLFLSASIFSFAGFLISVFLKETKHFSSSSPTSFSNFVFSKNLLVFSSGLLVAALGYGMVLNYINHYIVENFGEIFLNRTIISFYFSAGLLSFMGGYLIDKFGEYINCIVFFFLAGVTLIIFSICPSLSMAIFSLFLLGGLFQITPIAATVRVGKIVSEEKRSSAISAVFLWRDFGIGTSILCLGYIKNILSYEKGFSIVGLLFIFMAFFFLLKKTQDKNKIKGDF